MALQALEIEGETALLAPPHENDDTEVVGEQVASEILEKPPSEASPSQGEDFNKKKESERKDLENQRGDIQHNTLELYKIPNFHSANMIFSTKTRKDESSQ
ncbi:hypothetical protein Fot_41988 [Forsythia ovata]|uniref:Uncharacterized protein n=1 Tax=Forsythia ovata TaxID=205694 RepID=A0ABD1RKM9_9LAMI